MPSQTFIVRAHTRTIHTRPVTFFCPKCNHMTTRECYPGKPPKYCLECSPRRKRQQDELYIPEKGMFKPTHNLVNLTSGQKTPVCLEKSPQAGWLFVRTALDWFSGESIIKYHTTKGVYSQEVPLADYIVEALPADEVTTAFPSATSGTKTDKTITKKITPAKSSSELILVEPYSVKKMCDRFRCGDRLLKRMRTDPNFSQWSRSRDPEGITWEYRQGKYFPLLNQDQVNQELSATSEPDIQETTPTTNGSSQGISVEPYSVKQMCDRFRCGDRLLKRMRTDPNFSQWSRSRDPEGITWEYRQGKYFPLLNQDQVNQELSATSEPDIQETTPTTNGSSQGISVEPYSVKQMCDRFRCGDRLLKRMRTDPNFSQWSRSRDPEGITWEYRQGKYFPLVDQLDQVDQESSDTFEPEIEETIPTTNGSSQGFLVKPYSVKQMCDRFRCGDRLLKRMRTEPNFSQWSRSRDPEGITWEYRQGKYFPLVDQLDQVDQESSDTFEPEIEETIPTTNGSSQGFLVKPYSVKQMCDRFRCGDRLLKRMRTEPNFSQWSRSRDPEGITWEYRQGKYFPLLNQQ